MNRNDASERPIQLPSVLFEDEHLIVFDKPSGLLTNRDRWDPDRPNLMDMVHRRLSRSWFNAHRLDAETSGVLLCAKDKAVLRVLCGMFESGNVRKEYMAVTVGAPSPDRDVIRLDLAEDNRHPGRMQVVENGKKAETMYEVVENFGRYALVRVIPLSGRTHQVRVHLCAVGVPIAGDVLYGNSGHILLSRLKKGYKTKPEGERPLLGRLGLHAERLIFRHPVTDAQLEIVAPLPRDFTVTLKYLRRYCAASSALHGREALINE